MFIFTVDISDITTICTKLNFKCPPADIPIRSMEKLNSHSVHHTSEF